MFLIFIYLFVFVSMICIDRIERKENQNEIRAYKLRCKLHQAMKQRRGNA
jgi:hypothetical protein